MINENNKNSIGKYSLYASYIFRFLAILLILTPFTMATNGIGGIVAIIFYKIILKLIPFKISLYNDFLLYDNGEIDLEKLFEQWKKKRNYTIYLLSFVIISISLILINNNNYQDRIFFSILLFILLFISIPQILFLKYIKENIIQDFKPQKKEKGKFSIYSFYFDADSNNVKPENQTKPFVDKKQVIENVKNYSKKIELTKLNKEEIIIISSIVGLLFGLIFGYFFGTTVYTDYEGRKFSENHDYIVYSDFSFNYVLGFACFIVFGGIAYIYLNRQNSNNASH